MRLIFIIGHNFTVSFYSFLEFLADVAGRLFRHAASFEEQDQECQTDCANTNHPRHTKEMDVFLQSLSFTKAMVTLRKMYWRSSSSCWRSS